MNLEPSHISNLAVTATISSIRSNHEAPLWQRALQKLTQEEHQSLTSTKTPLRWIDGSLHERFLDHCYEELHTTSGEPRENFAKRNIEESGSDFIKSAYRFILSMISTTKNMYKTISLQSKIYNDKKSTTHSIGLVQ
jgi:hypothetical protein